MPEKPGHNWFMAIGVYTGRFVHGVCCAPMGEREQRYSGTPQGGPSLPKVGSVLRFVVTLHNSHSHCGFWKALWILKCMPHSYPLLVSYLLPSKSKG